MHAMQFSMQETCARAMFRALLPVWQTWQGPISQQVGKRLWQEQRHQYAMLLSKQPIQNRNLMHADHQRRA